MKRIKFVGVAVAILFAACHADENDPVGQARELKDPVRRSLAVSNLHRIYTRALDQHQGNREDPEVKKVADAIVEPLTQAYIDYPENTRLGKLMLDIMKEMRDPRTLPALVQALRWRQGVTEEHAVRAAQVFQVLEVPEGKKGEVIEGLAAALEQVSGTRGIDNQMRREFTVALGEMEDARARPPLERIAIRQSEDQDFLFNRLAAQQLGRLADAASVDAMIKALFLFSPTNPAFRMNDVAAEALVRIGRPAYEPLLRLLRGENEDANRLAGEYIHAIAERDEAAAALMTPALVVGQEATFAIGALGFRDAIEPSMTETQVDDPYRKFNASVALVRLNLEDSDLPRVRETLTRVFNEMPEGLNGARLQLQLIAVMRQLYDAELLGLFRHLAEDEDIVPDLRIEGSLAYALLVSAGEASAVRRCTGDEPCEGDPYQPAFQENAVLLDAARECDQAIACWLGKLNASDVGLVRKAAFMLGRFGRGNDQAIAALVEKLSHDDIVVRLTALAALDRIAVGGCPEAVALIDRLQSQEDGTRIWTLFSRQALPTQARLRVRARSAG